MDSPEAAARWMAHLRDEQLSQFSFLLVKNECKGVKSNSNGE
jgi:hypothetical protein